MSSDVSFRVLELLTDLTAVLDLTKQALTDIVATQTPEAIPLPLKDSAKRQYLPTNFPKIGGRDFKPQPSRLFETDEFLNLWKTQETRACYAAACTGLANLSAMFKLPIYKVSTTGVDRVWKRRDEMRRNRIGALWHNGEAYVEDLTGWDDWFPSHLYPQRLPSPGSPVVAEPHAIIVPLPLGMTAKQFDELFDKETKKAALNSWVMTQEGRDHCSFIGANPLVGQRSTRFRAGEPKISPAKEICCFSIYEGADRIIAICEKIILEAVGLLPANGKAAQDSSL